MQFRTALSGSIVLAVILGFNQPARTQSTAAGAAAAATNAGGFFGTLTSFPKTPGQMQQFALEHALTKALGETLPVKLDATSTYPTVENSALPGGIFKGQSFAVTPESFATKLAPGDWTIPALAFCQEYSVHRPGAGTAYKIGPLQGKEAELIGTFLWRGVLAGKSPNELQAVEWAIEAGVTYDKLPKPYQADIDLLIPAYKAQLGGDWMERTRSAYTTAVADPVKAIKMLGMLPGIGTVGGLFLHHLPTPPPYDQLLQKLGPAGRFAIDGQQLQTKFQANQQSQEMQQQVLFEGQGAQLPPTAATEGPWTVKAEGVYMRFRVQSGNLHADNVLEVRVMPGQAPTLLSVMGLSLPSPATPQVNNVMAKKVELADLSNVVASGTEIGFPVGVGAQALVIVLPMTTPLPKAVVMQAAALPAEPKHEDTFRGRIVAHGGNLKAAVPWSQGTPPTMDEALKMFYELKEQLTPAQLLSLEAAFGEAETYVVKTSEAGGATAGTERTFPRLKAKDGDLKVMIEVQSGQAFVADSGHTGASQ